MLNPDDLDQQEEAFTAAALTACTLLQHEFADEKMQYSRSIDPIIGVSFTGLFDFFVKLFGEDYLVWWREGRPTSEEGEMFRATERCHLRFWRSIVREVVEDYCSFHGLPIPNRYTTVQPAGTKSLLTGASCGWHLPKATRYIRRITFRRDDAVALACMDMGYSVVPSQSCTDENGNLLDDPFDPRVAEWLVEIPVEVPWAEAADRAEFDPFEVSAKAQFDFYMEVQDEYSTHTTSATLELREDEIDELATCIHEAIESPRHGYVSAAILARFDAKSSAFPRLPFEPISKAEFDALEEAVKARRVADDFHTAMLSHVSAVEEAQEVQCSSGFCESKDLGAKPSTPGDIFAAI